MMTPREVGVLLESRVGFVPSIHSQLCGNGTFDENNIDLFCSSPDFSVNYLTVCLVLRDCFSPQRGR